MAFVDPTGGPLVETVVAKSVWKSSRGVKVGLWKTIRKNTPEAHELIFVDNDEYFIKITLNRLLDHVILSYPFNNGSFEDISMG